MQNKKNTLSFVGLGKLGLALQSSFAFKKFDTIGFDINYDLVKKIKNYKEDHQEKGVKYIIRNNKKFNVSFNLEELFWNSKITFITLPTPSLKNGKFSLRYLYSFFNNLKKCKELIKKNKQVFIIVSTINPGDLSNKLSKYVSSVLNLKYNEDFFLIYNPEFIALGSVLNDLLNTDFVLIGSESKKKNLLLKSIYTKFYGKKFINKIFTMSSLNAEISKIAFNAFTTMKITFANQLGLLAKKNTMINPNDILSCIGTSKRISNHYFKSGLPFSGPCFPRDNLAYSKFFKDYSVKNDIPLLVDKTNKQVLKAHLNEIKKICFKNNVKQVLIIGSSYKENTPVIDHSFGEKVITNLFNHTKISVFDFLDQKFLKKKRPNINYYNKIKNINLNHIDLIVIAHNDEKLLKYKQEFLKIKNIYDPWNLIT